jgi:SLT domain-containing protein
VTGNEIDHAVLADVLDRVERDALPLIRRAIGEGALASMWRAGESVGTNAGRRVQYLRWLDAEGA